MILQAINHIKDINANIDPYLFLVGEIYHGLDYINSMHKYIKDNSLHENCSFLGAIPKQVLYKIYQNIDLIIIASISVGLPLTLVEAFKFKKPVIATKVGGIPEIIHHKYNGILIDDNAESLADAIIQLGSNRKLYNMIINNATFTFDKYFDLETNLKKTEQLFDKILQEE